MKKIWVVEWVDYDDSGIVAVCTDKQVATSIFDSYDNPRADGELHVFEFDSDVPQDEDGKFSKSIAMREL